MLEYSANTKLEVHRFDNDFGASVVSNPRSYGGKSQLWELVVLKWVNGVSDIAYDTEITDGALGWLSYGQVEEVLARIEKLEKK